MRRCDEVQTTNLSIRHNLMDSRHETLTSTVYSSLDRHKLDFSTKMAVFHFAGGTCICAVLGCKFGGAKHVLSIPSTENMTQNTVTANHWK